MDVDVQWAGFWVNLGLAIITLFAVLVALYKEDWRKPKIKVGFGNQPPYSIYPYGNQMGMLFRIRIVNGGKTVARNCQVKLLSVKSQAGRNVLDKEEPDILKWSGSPREMGFRADPSKDINLTSDINQLIPIFREKKDITPQGGSEFCDLFWIDSQKKLIFSSSGGRNFICEKEGRYFAIIEISGDNFEPTRKEIKIYTPLKVNYENNDIKIYLAGIEKVRNISQ